MPTVVCVPTEQQQKGDSADEYVRMYQDTKKRTHYGTDI